MPGTSCSSLWLVPPPDSPIAKLLSSLITNTTPSHFPYLNPPPFAPHITLTSEIDPSIYGDEPQKWLDQRISIRPNHQVTIRFEALDTESPFFRKLAIRVKKYSGLEQTSGLTELAYICREAGVTKDEHAARSADITIDKEKMAELKQALRELQIGFEDDNMSPDGAMTGWEGGDIWLVPTDKGIEDWQPIATKRLP
ncbi:MAG: hypothetical protein M1820_007371 [Bogoriella megaspora]|nr:MAG: hypothetical protein M1820_007371 [Bogoriella megaspora]